MNAHTTFGQCLKSILDSRDLSLQTAAKIMQMKSATSLSRIIHDEVNTKTLEKFCDQLLSNESIALQPEEIAALQRALAIQRTGIDDYIAQQIMWQLLISDPEKTQQEDYAIHGYGGAMQHTGITSLSQVIALYRQCTDIEIIITGCCHFSLLNAFYPLAARKTNPARITHFLHNRTKTPHVLLGSITAIRRFLSLTGYTAYITDPIALTPEACAIYSSNEILCQFVDPCGKKRMHHMVLSAPRQLMMIEYRHPSPFSFHIARLQQHQASLSPIQTQYPANVTIYDYIRMADKKRRTENNRSIYSIKPDIHVTDVHPDILAAAAMRHLKNLNHPVNNAFKKIYDQLYSIQMMRWQNIYTKKKVTHTVLSVSAMHKFAQTGLQSDHFFALDPYTPAERRKIFLHLRQQMIENPYFNLHFSAEDSMPFHLEITGYEGYGVLISNAHSPRNLAKGHAESLITQQVFNQAFQDFFTKELIPHHVLPMQKGIALLDQWIAALPEND